jgi:O-antigen ligase
MVLDRLAGLSALDVGTAAERIQLWQNMWEDWKQAPLLGHGAHAYAKFRDDPATGISENFLLELMHSAGLVGFGIFFFVIVKIVVRGLVLFSTAEGLRRMPWGLPILGGFVSMCLSSLTNPGMTGGFFWVAMALVVCALELGSPSLNYLTSVG